MNQVDEVCVGVRELLPDFVAERLDKVDRETIATHIAACAMCQEELELVRLLFAARATVPQGLDDRVLDAVTRPPRPAHRPWWGLSAAAVAAIALGVGISSDPGVSTAPSDSDFATEFEEGEFWVSDDGMLAGAPSLDALSDEALMELLEELAAETPGGAA